MRNKRGSDVSGERASKRANLDYRDTFDDSNNKLRVSSLRKSRIDDSKYVQGTIVSLKPGQLQLECGEGGGTVRRVDLLFGENCFTQLSQLKFAPDVSDELAVLLKGAQFEAEVESLSAANSTPPKIIFEFGVVLTYLKRLKRPSDVGNVVDTWTDIARSPSVEPGWFSSPVPSYSRGRDLQNTFIPEVAIPEEEEPSSNDVDGEMDVDSPERHNDTVPDTDDDALTRMPSIRQPEKDVPRLLVEVVEPKSNRQKKREKEKNTQCAKHQAADQAKSNSAEQPAESSKKEDNNEGGHDNEQAKKREENKKKKKKEKKNKRKQESKKEKEAPTTAHLAREPGTSQDAARTIPANLNSISTHTVPPAVSRNSIDSGAKAPASVAPITNHATADLSASRESADGFLCGLTSGNFRYSAISGLHDRGEVYAVKNIIGIVQESCPPKTTSRGEYSVNFKIMDPSCCNFYEGNHLNEPGWHSVNAFTKKHPTWLPTFAENDIVVLRGIKASRGQGGGCSTGYEDHFQWAIYDRSEKEAKCPGISQRVDLVNNKPFSPYLDEKLQQDVLDYCQKLADWWDNVQLAREEEKKEVHQVGGGEISSTFVGSHSAGSASTSNRQYRLIEEIGPEVAPNGYFNCVVEVLQVHKQFDTSTICVTDYSPNERMHRMSNKWCPDSLSGSILTIEMSDSAARAAEDIQERRFYQLKNVRAKMGNGGYLEGRMRENKITRLKEADAEQNAHLRALLQRKKDWEASENDSVVAPDEKLIREVALNEFFTCTVEVLFAESKSDKDAWLYVTDYTRRDDLQNLDHRPPREVKQVTRSSKLEGQILNIYLKDKQVDDAKTCEPGSILRLKGLRLKPHAMTRDVQGTLSGNESRIHVIEPGSQDPKLKELLARKSLLDNSKDAVIIKCDSLQNRRSPQKKRAEVPTKTPSYNPSKTISALEAAPDQAKYRLQAKVIRITPSTLDRLCLRYCDNCGQKIRDIHQACVECSELDDPHEHVQYKYFFSLEVQDYADDRAVLVVMDKVPFLDGLERTDLRDSDPACKALSERLAPLLPSGKRRDDIPMLEFLVDRFTIEEKVYYGVLNFREIP